MGYSVSVYIDTTELDRIAAQLDVKKAQVLRTLGAKVEIVAKSLCPVDTGALWNSLHMFMPDNSTARIESKPGAVNANTGAPVAEYGIYQELGFHHYRDGFVHNPFLTPAVESIATEFVSPQTWSPLFT